MAQEADIIFVDPIDTATASAKPVEGIHSKIKYLEMVVTAGDTLGKKYEVHSTTSPSPSTNTEKLIQLVLRYDHLLVHEKIAQELTKTKWLPAKEKGKPLTHLRISSDEN